MKQKINFRLTLIAFIAIFVTTIAIVTISYGLFQQQVKDDLRISTELLADTGILQERYDDKESTPNFDALIDENLRMTWIDHDGSVIYDNDADASKLANHSDRPEVKDAMSKGVGESVRKSDTLNMNTYYYALLLDNGTVIRLSTKARTISSVFMAALPVIIVIMILIGLMCGLLGHMLTRKLIEPIEYMAEHINDPDTMSVYKELQPFADKIHSQHENILESAKMRQDFTANVSHELKTPLTAISGYAELWENQMIPPSQEKETAQKIRNNAQRLLSLINDIIELSELDHRDKSENMTNFNLLQLADECCQSMQINAAKAQVHLSCSGGTAMINGERDSIKELIENLVQNAIRYNRPGGYVKVTVDVSEQRPFLRVADNGIGIPEDSQARIFERFYRVDKSRSRETGGTGLGLAIVKHIAEIHGATISLESVVGIGTTITVEF